MSVFTERFHRVRFDKITKLEDGKKIEKISELPIGAEITATAFFINKGKYGDYATVHTEGAVYYLPSYMTENVKIILNDNELIKAVNNGECKLKFDGWKDIKGKENRMAVVKWL